MWRHTAYIETEFPKEFAVGPIPDERFEGIGHIHDWVFFNPDHPRMRAQGFRKSFEQARRKAGVPHLTEYTCRHYFISKAIMSGVDLFTITKWVGHGSTKMIEEVYGHLSNDHKKAQMAKISIGGALAQSEQVS